MNEELAKIISERADTRVGFIQARFHRDTPARYYDSVVSEPPAVTQPAWDAFSVKQLEMDIAGDHLIMACAAVTDYVLMRP
jgi:hypothetical protein